MNLAQNEDLAHAAEFGRQRRKRSWARRETHGLAPRKRLVNTSEGLSSW